MEGLISFSVIVLTSVLLYFISNRFADASSNIGDYLKLSRSVKGATFDAIAGSMPELLVALFAVIFFKSFEIGIGTIAGSALFNLLVIPGICVLVAPVAFKVSRDVIDRDGLFYIISFVALAIHLSHGFWSMLQTFGINHPRYNYAISKLTLILPLFFLILFAGIPLYFMTGLGASY